MLHRVAVFLLLVGLAAAARADNVADEAELRFRRGAELYSKGRIEEALGEFFASNRLSPNRNVVFNIARCWEKIGRSHEAYRYYNDLRAEPWSDDDRKSLDEALARLRPHVALVHVETDPPGADVFVEREDLGSQGLTPRTLALPAGKTTIIARLEGFRTALVEVTLEKGRQTPVRLELERIWGHFDVRSTPPAEVRLDDAQGPVVCITPCEVPALPGRHTLHFTVDGHVPTARDAEVGPDARSTIDVALDPRPPPVGKVVVQANRARALVRVDGIEAGFTPVVLDAIVVGKHEIEVSYPELETWRTVVSVQEGVSSVVEAKLSVPAPTVSAAAKSLGSANDTAASVTVISAEEIRAMGWQTLAQALRGVRGIYLSNDRTYDYVGVRGFQPPGDFNTRILVLVDGHPYNDVWVGQAGIGHDLDVDLSQVERIEVVRGPNSALYGSSAVFGVINVVHRLAPRQGVVEVRATGGNQGAGKARVTAGYEGEQWGASISAAGFRADNEATTLLDLPGDAARAKVRGLDGESARHLQALARFGGFRLVAVHNDRAKEIPTAPYGTLLGAEGTRARDVRTFVEGRYEHAFASGVDVTARGYWDQVRFSGAYRYDDETLLDEDRADWAGGEARVRLPSMAGHRLTAGVELQRWLSVTQNVRYGSTVLLDDDRSATVLSGYVHDDWKLHDKIKAELAVRADNYAGAVEQLALAPRAALLGTLYQGGVTKLAVGRAFRVPTIYERYYSDGDQSQKRPPPESLEPEVIIQAELEHTHRINEELLVTGGVFASQLSHVLRLETDSDDGLLVFRSGTKPIRAVGAEFDLRWQPSRLQLLSFAYSFQLSEDPEAGGALVNSPRHVAALRGMQPLGRALAVGFELIWNAPRLGRDRQLHGEALLASVALSGDLPAWGLHYSVSAQNLFDERYALPAGDELAAAAIPQAGRTLQLTVSKSFF